MGQMFIFRKKLRLVAVLLFAAVAFLAVGKPILAADMMAVVPLAGMHEGGMSLGETHPLFDHKAGMMLRSDAARDNHTMICCVEGGEKFSVQSSVTLKLAKESGAFAQGDPISGERTSCSVQKNTILPPGDTVLLSSCQRE